MNRQISFFLTGEQFEAVKKVAEVMRAQVSEVATAALLQDLDGFELNGDRESQLLHSLRIYSDGSEVPNIEL